MTQHQEKGSRMKEIAQWYCDFIIIYCFNCITFFLRYRTLFRKFRNIF